MISSPEHNALYKFIIYGDSKIMFLPDALFHAKSIV